jgi:hypothetical protein
VAGSAVLAACSSNTPNPQNAAGALDTAALRTRNFYGHIKRTSNG